MHTNHLIKPTYLVKIYHHSDASQSSSTSTRRQRHSIAGQMGLFKIIDIAGGFRKMTMSTNSLFSTAVISGSSSAPNLRDMIPSTASASGNNKPIERLRSLFDVVIYYLFYVQCMSWFMIDDF